MLCDDEAFGVSSIYIQTTDLNLIYEMFVEHLGWMDITRAKNPILDVLQ